MLSLSTVFSTNVKETEPLPPPCDAVAVVEVPAHTQSCIEHATTLR